MDRLDKIAYSNIFKYPRRMFKSLLILLYPVVKCLYKFPKVLSIEETIDKIVRDKLSICRFGDGELLYISDKRNLPFQKQNENLRLKLIQIFNSNNKRLLIGLPIGFYSLKRLKPKSKSTWKAVIVWTYPKIRKLININKTYYNASMTRLYMDYLDYEYSNFLFEKIKKIWKNRDFLIVEGVKTRLGVGNDLFSEGNLKGRILGPESDSFSQAENIFSYITSNFSKNILILVALGPGGKSLVYDLCLFGYQVVDIGNIDIEYEWFLKRAVNKVKIKGKYTSEAIGGRLVSDINNVNYENEIIDVFK